MNKKNLIIFYMFSLHYVSLLSKIDIKAMMEGMGQTFGAPPRDYVYNYEVWSDASVPIYLAQEPIVCFMGAYSPGTTGTFGKKTLPSIFDAPDGLSTAVRQKQQYYFNMYISDDNDPLKHPIYKKSLTDLPLQKNDTKVFYYHVYTAGILSKGRMIHKPAVEVMGYQDPTQVNNQDKEKQGNIKFSGQLSEIFFYNSSGTDLQISLTYGTSPYTFTVEKYSYNFLGLPTKEEKADQKADAQNDLPAFSLRPNTITFAAYNAETKKYDQFRSLSLPSKGFEGTSCRIKIFQDEGKSLEVGIQGHSPGNFDLPVTARTRDITPCVCTFWYQSLEQIASKQGLSDLPGQIWVVYNGVDSPLVAKVMPGQVVSWNLTRPAIWQADQFVYFVYVVTDDDAMGKSFAQKIAQGLIGTNISNEYNKAANRALQRRPIVQAGLDVNGDAQVAAQILSSDKEIAALMGTLNIANGMIEDTELGVIGYLAGADVFTAQGLGFGRFYYTLSPSVINFNGVVSLVSGCLDSAKTKTLGGADADVVKSITKSVQDWFAMYMKKPTQAQDLVEKYLIQFGNATIVDAKTGGLTQVGKSRLQEIVSGNVSLKFPSMKLSNVSNQYVYDFGKKAPENMPNVSKKL